MRPSLTRNLIVHTALFIACSGLAIWCVSQGNMTLGSINAFCSVANAIAMGICIGVRI